jgi:hypothetical protein
VTLQQLKGLHVTCYAGKDRNTFSDERNAHSGYDTSSKVYYFLTEQHLYDWRSVLHSRSTELDRSMPDMRSKPIRDKLLSVNSIRFDFYFHSVVCKLQSKLSRCCSSGHIIDQ